jgi:beta-N-acetylhexosaminidase
VILFTRNIDSRSQLRKLSKSLQQAVPDGDPPLLVTIDQEGGLVKRLSGPPDYSAAEMGRRNNSTLARHQGRDTAKNLLDVGVNVNLAPVVDVGRPGSIMRKQERSFSGDPDKVARLAGAFARGLGNNGVGATAKHFPGLGAARSNEDYTVNRIDLKKSELRSTDELPFAKLAADGLPLVMVSTAIYPALDDRPALFAPKIANHELRDSDRVGFDGVSITDDLDTPAAAKYGSAERRARLAAHAGNDMLMYAQSYSDGTRAARELVDAVRAGHLSRAGMERAVERIRALREALAG